MDAGICRDDPSDLSGRARLRREGQALTAEPKPDLTHRSEFGETIKYGANRASNRFIGMKAYFAIGIAPDKAHWESTLEFTALRFVSNAAIESCTKNVEFRFAHGALQAKNQSIVEQRRMVHPITVTDQCVGNDAQVQQAIPIGVIARQPGNLQPEDDPDPAESDFGGHAGKSGAIDNARAGYAEVLVNDKYLLFGPTEVTRPLNQCVLTCCGFPMMFDLRRCRLANVDERRTLRMNRFDFVIDHCSAPVSRPKSPWRRVARGFQ